MSETKVSAPEGVPFIDIRREFDAPRDLVFRAFTDPELLVQWLGPRKYEMIIDTYDVRAGGSWRYIHRDDAGNEYGFHGVFHGEPSPDGFVQTFEFEGAPGHVSLDRLVLEEHGGRTTAHTHSVFQSVEARDAMVEHGMAEGLNEGFERLDEILGRLVPVA
ncbi:MAG TPA: SRPBCC family protein [Candidatus Deferrimicrobium sp.]|nr:SRPBCC family protein [Candidatus Deferrimicrobium sp.]